MYIALNVKVGKLRDENMTSDVLGFQICPKCGKSMFIADTDFWDLCEGEIARVVECLECEEKYAERWVFDRLYNYVLEPAEK